MENNDTNAVIVENVVDSNADVRRLWYLSHRQHAKDLRRIRLVLQSGSDGAGILCVAGGTEIGGESTTRVAGIFSLSSKYTGCRPGN